MRPIVASVVVGVLVAAIVAPSRGDERVDITATDGVQLIGHLVGTSGPGIVLVPAPDRDTRTWEAAADALAASGFRVLRFDPRGHGDSDGPADPAALARDAEGAYRYLIGRKIRPVHLVAEGVAVAAAETVAAKVAAKSIALTGDLGDAAVRAEVVRALGAAAAAR